VPVLIFGEVANPFLNEELLIDTINEMEQLILPTGRHVRISLRAEATSEGAPEAYFGV